MIITQPKWKKYANLWYQCLYKGHLIDLRWFKTRLSVSIDGGEWIRYYGNFKLWEAKSKALVIADSNLTNQCTRIATLSQNQPPQPGNDTG